MVGGREGKVLSYPTAHVSAGFFMEFTPCSTPHSALGVASLSPASAGVPGLGELSLDVQMEN